MLSHRISAEKEHGVMRRRVKAGTKSGEATCGKDE